MNIRIATSSSVPRWLVCILGFCLPADGVRAGNDFEVLVFTKTAGFHHNSIADGVALIQSLGTQNQFGVSVTADAANFTTENLSQYAVVVWLSTTGNVLNATQQTAFETYLQAGGGYVGVHAAADCEYNWQWYRVTPFFYRVVAENAGGDSSPSPLFFSLRL